MKNTSKKISRLGALVDRWIVRGGATELQRDKALALLEEIRAAVESKPSKPAKPAAVPKTSTPKPAKPSKPVAKSPKSPKPPKPAAKSKPVAAKKSAPDTFRSRRIAPELIRSLYGDDLDTTPAPVAKPSKPSKTKPEPKPAAKKSRPATKAPNKDSKSAPKTNSRALGVNHRALDVNPRALGVNTRALTTEQPIREPKFTLRNSLALNDRFQIIREVFDGDAARFDRTIKKLDGFPDLDSAVIHIHEHYDWSADSPGVRMLVDLLQRKFARPRR